MSYQQEGYGTDPLHTGLAILPYGIGQFVGPLVTAPQPARLRPWLLTIGMAIQVSGYAAVAVGGASSLGGRSLAMACLRSWPDALVRINKWKRADERSPCFCSKLKSNAVDVQPRVRKKSLYLKDRTDWAG